ncbi:putative defensin-like protein 184 [Mercurialis annua]|uniref:putative defensin-like protein 184 n=1 Tax=Mercurialis annua TaxID=3986 RepID=UPI002160CB67|nr:putative defensin-like protein 184 [Mercurialis annua]XP_050220712.1 putative defensin-like protein 184 [Mercurialis annua]
MVKFPTFFFVLVLLVIFATDENVVMRAKARDCHKVWKCKGNNRCWDDCKTKFNGMGQCDLYTAPPVPKQCFCAYKC